MLSLLPDSVTVRRDSGEGVVSLAGLRVGDEFLVAPGGSVATDGVVVGGHSAVDASSVTGESIPVEVGPGSVVTGGVVNTSGRLVVRAARVGADTQLARSPGWSSRHRAARRRCSGWPTGWPRCSYRW